MSKSLREKIEEETYQIIDELADELDLDVPFYPEVYWVGKNFSFDSLGLGEDYEEYFSYMKKEKNSFLLNDSKIIFIMKNNSTHIGEESGHFLHSVNSKIIPKNKSDEERFSICCIEEMIGYFCSKLIEPDRKNHLSKFPDAMIEYDYCLEKIAMKHIESKKIKLEYVSGRNRQEKLHHITNRYTNMENFTIYQQGYGLGEHLFNSYISGIKTKDDARALILKDFKKKDSATNEFLKLKNEMLSYSERRPLDKVKFI